MHEEECSKDYWMLVFGKEKSCVYNEHVEYELQGRKSQLREVFDKAHELRDFEIQMYWKRALYFWGPQAVLIVAFLGLHEGYINKAIGLLPNIVVGLVALVFTMAWRLALKGAKRWQENWEMHIDHLETLITGNLYTTVLFKAPGKDRPLWGGEDNPFYSVTRVNESINLLLIFAWGFALALTLLPVIDCLIGNIFASVLCVVFVLSICSVLFYEWLKSRLETQFDCVSRCKLKGRCWCYRRSTE